MTQHVLDDDLMICQYNRGDTMRSICECHAVDLRTIYRHMRWYGIEPNRKVSTSWTPHEEMQLIDAYRSGVTGQEYKYWVSTRTSVACKGHLRKLGM